MQDEYDRKNPTGLMTIYYYLEENPCLMTIFIISSPSWVIRWPFIIISKKTISWRQVRRKNWWLAQAAFPPSRCRSYVWIVTDKTGKNDLIEKKYHLFPLHDHDKAFTEYVPDVLCCAIKNLFLSCPVFLRRESSRLLLSFTGDTYRWARFETGAGSYISRAA